MVGLFIELVSTGGGQVLQKLIMTMAHTFNHLPTSHTVNKGQMISEVDMSNVRLVGPLGRRHLVSS